MSTANLLSHDFGDSDDEDDFNPAPADLSDDENVGSDTEQAPTRAMPDPPSDDENGAPAPGPNERVRSPEGSHDGDLAGDDEDEEGQGDDTAGGAVDDEDEEDEEDDEDEEEVTVSYTRGLGIANTGDASSISYRDPAWNGANNFIGSPQKA